MNFLFQAVLPIWTISSHINQCLISYMVLVFIANLFSLRSLNSDSKQIQSVTKRSVSFRQARVFSLIEIHRAESRRNHFTGKRYSSDTFLAEELTPYYWLQKSEPSVEGISICLCHLLLLLHILGRNEASVICILFQSSCNVAEACRAFVSCGSSGFSRLRRIEIIEESSPRYTRRQLSVQ